MKFFVPLLVLAAVCTLAACSTSANRRDFYGPKKGEGPWTRSLENGTYKERALVDSRPGSSRVQPAAAPAAPSVEAVAPPVMPE